MTERLGRREFLHALSVAMPMSALQAAASPPNQILSDDAVEDHRGDPDGPSERLTFDSRLVEDLITGPQKASFAKYEPKLAAALLADATKFVGFSRETHEQEIGTIRN